MTAPKLTASDAELIWQAITETTIAQGNAAADELLNRAVTEAGNLTRTVAANIRRDDYRLRDSNGIPDSTWTRKLLADALIDDQFPPECSALNDKFTLSDRGGSLAARTSAKTRNNKREAVRHALDRLSHDAFCTLIDRLADATAKAA